MTDAPKCPACGVAWRDHAGPTAMCEEIQRLKAIIERIMTAHWDLASCRCWVCTAGREAGCRPREEYLLHRDGNRERFPVPANGWDRKSLAAELGIDISRCTGDYQPEFLGHELREWQCSDCGGWFDKSLPACPACGKK